MTAPAFSAPLPVLSHSFRISAIGFAKKAREIMTSPPTPAAPLEAAVAAAVCVVIPELPDAPAVPLLVASVLPAVWVASAPEPDEGAAEPADSPVVTWPEAPVVVWPAG